MVAIGPQGRLIDVANPAQPVSLPSGLTEADLDTSALVAGKTVSGRRGSIVFAAAPYQAEVEIPRAAGRPAATLDLTQAVILTRRPPTGVHSTGIWFLIAAGVTLAAAALVADRLGPPHHPTPRGGRGDHPPDRRR